MWLKCPLATIAAAHGWGVRERERHEATEPTWCLKEETRFMACAALKTTMKRENEWRHKIQQSNGKESATAAIKTRCNYEFKVAVSSHETIPPWHLGNNKPVGNFQGKQPEGLAALSVAQSSFSLSPPFPHPSNCASGLLIIELVILTLL